MQADASGSRWLQDIERRLEANLEKLSGNSANLVEKLVNYLPQMMFLLLPIFALLLKACYLFSPFYYLEHLVFSLHFHSFGYLLYFFGTLVDIWLYEKGIAMPLLCIFMVYLPLALMRTYGSGPGGAAARAIIILAVNSILLLLTFALYVLVSLTLM